MAYYGSQPEQTKAQIRSTRGETIDLALPLSCLIGELRKFLIEEYNYDPNTRLLYNGKPTDDTSYVCDYPFGSLMIATPADTQLPHQSYAQRNPSVTHPAPAQQHNRQQQQRYPRQQQQRYSRQSNQEHQHNQPQHHHEKQNQLPQQPQQRQLHQQQHHNQQHQQPQPEDQIRPEAGRVGARFSPTISGNADSCRKGKVAETSETQRNISARDMGPVDVPQEAVKPKRINTDLPHRPRSSSLNLRSASTESSASQGRPTRAEGAAAPTKSPAPTPSPVTSAPTNNGASTAPGSGRSPSSTNPRSSPYPQGSQETPVVPLATEPKAAHGPPNTTAEATNSEVESVENQRRRVQLTLECHIPSLNKVVPVTLSGDCSVLDIVMRVTAVVPELTQEAHVVHRGRILPMSAQAKLFDHGIRSDTRIFIASGEYSNTEKITLLEIEEDTSAIERATSSPLTDLQRKGYYEELMRILFRTDGLQSLEGEWRQRRKDAVKHITSLQDSLGVEGTVK